MSEENIIPKVGIPASWWILIRLYFQGYPVHELSFVLFFLLPILLLTFLYISMVQTIRESGGRNIGLSKHAGMTSSLAIADNRHHIICMLSKFGQFR